MTMTKVFQSGGSQAVRIPQEFRFRSDEVCIRKIGDMVVLIPKDQVWNTFEASLGHFSDDFLDGLEELRS